ncbi:hypothetical protein GCM10029976_091810 [Kribbella albertanoniae]
MRYVEAPVGAAGLGRHLGELAATRLNGGTAVVRLKAVDVRAPDEWLFGDASGDPFEAVRDCSRLRQRVRRGRRRALDYARRRSSNRSECTRHPVQGLDTGADRVRIQQATTDHPQRPSTRSRS